jgi:hypothetical protein
MKKNKIKKEFIKTLHEGLEEIIQSTPGKPKPKETIVTFDKSTNPYQVTFSERGFEINGTRFSFEFLETALSKDVNIVLEKGQGLVLDSIKMEKILKYKDLYSVKKVSGI